MACCRGGYAENRFEGSVDKNFFCPICTDVLKDPVQCHNQHYFCRSCITKHLKNSQTCPVCVEKLTEEALSKPPRIVQDYLDSLVIDCEHSERGCTNLVELGRLEAHVTQCVYRPMTCPNEKCDAIVNHADLDEHTSEVCEYREVYCEECDDKMSVKKFEKHGCFRRKDIEAMKLALLQLKDQVKQISDTQREILNTQKEMLLAIQNPSSQVVEKSKANARQAAKPDTKSHPGKVVVIGGQCGILMSSSWLDTVEMYCMISRTWTKLHSLKRKRSSATAHCYNHRIIVIGGMFNLVSLTKSIETIGVPEEFRALLEGNSLLVRELPFECYGHKTALLNDNIWVIGGKDHHEVSLCSNVICMVPTYSRLSFQIKYEMAKPVSFHGLEVVNDSQLLILGGSRTGANSDAVNTVLLYDTVTNVLRELRPLPFAILDMATVKHGDDVIIIGGTNKDGDHLNTVLKYVFERQECVLLPVMKHKRAECAAVISGNNLFVMGGFNKEQKYLSSVECLDLEHLVWHDLPPMKEAKSRMAAVVLP